MPCRSPPSPSVSQILHEEVDSAILQVQGGLLDTSECKVPQVTISCIYVERFIINSKIVKVQPEDNAKQSP